LLLTDGPPPFAAGDAKIAIDGLLKDRPEGVSISAARNDNEGLKGLFAGIQAAEEKQPEIRENLTVAEKQGELAQADDNESRVEDVGEEARRDLEAIKAQEERWETEDEEERARQKAEDEERDRREKERLEREAKEAADEEKRQKVQLEARRRAALRRLTICPAGFSWYKCPGGYRCGGGTHFVSDATVDAHTAL